ncbi:leucyl aminopeptidase [Methylococcus sp. EFPC2]|uniref:leucyl aminopeptidase n=1 Tax=Methylococcus sp. EFPC2 TaxID=2812648 RepID=UPI00196896F6|nr:leucyl aminopeptidase [Methylococcus sp. EFPC2]QSA97995.1 leucyl aminopeptidase [Methylococcus sp. EFPC2]
MDYSIKSEAPDKISDDCLIVGFYAKRKLGPTAAALDQLHDGLLTRLLKRDDIEGKTGDILLVNPLPHGKTERLLLVGLGKAEELNIAAYRKALAAAIKALKDNAVKSAASALHEAEVKGLALDGKIRQNIEVFENALYQFTQLKSDKTQIKPARLAKLNFLVDGDSHQAQAELGVKQGKAIADAMLQVRDLANLPGNICTPSYLAEQAVKLGKAHKKLKTKVLDESDLEELGMGSFLSVSKGSRQPARLIVLEYQGASAKTKPYVLVGKGLTFDAGGISLKPAANMDEMKYDMCGGASVIGALSVAAELALPINVVGLIPASENLPDGNANKPGDVVTSMAGLTIEILNTDAEGRLILCDTLTYAKRYDPVAVIDVATLTGACIVALGRHPSGLISNDDELSAQITDAGERAADRVWRLPLWDEYQEQLKSNFADIANIGGPDGGTITAGAFLSRFTKDYKWAHLDIAGTAWKTGADKGATGRPVPLLAQYLIDRAQ